jgi:hypothetical protein
MAEANYLEIAGAAYKVCQREMDMIGVLLEAFGSMFTCLAERRTATSEEIRVWSAAIDEAARKQKELSAAIDAAFQPLLPLLPKFDN